MNEMNKFPNSFEATQFSPLLSEEEIQSIVDKMAYAISKKYENDELIILSVLKGSPVFLSDLVRKIKNVNIQLDFIRLDAIGRSRDSLGTIKICKDITVNIRDKNILLVKEVIDSGNSISFIKKHLELNSPKSMEIITLLDKPYKRNISIKANYIGKQIKDEFVIGYGMDLDQYGRNLKEIYQLNYAN